MASPATIPVTTVAPQPTPTTTLNTPAFRHFLTRLSDSLRRALSNQRPWHELVDRSAFSRPDSLSDATSRLRRNISYFRTNYFTVFALVVAITLISNPFSLLVLVALLAAWCFLYLFRPADSPVVIGGRQFSDRETLVGLVAISVVTVFLSSVGSLLMTAATVGAVVVGVHGAFRAPEDLFLDDQEAGVGGGGLLSFLGGAGSGSAAAIASRV